MLMVEYSKYIYAFEVECFEILSFKKVYSTFFILCGSFKSSIRTKTFIELFLHFLFRLTFPTVDGKTQYGPEGNEFRRLVLFRGSERM